MLDVRNAISGILDHTSLADVARRVETVRQDLADEEQRSDR